MIDVTGGFGKHFKAIGLLVSDHKISKLSFPTPLLV